MRILPLLCLSIVTAISSLQAAPPSPIKIKVDAVNTSETKDGKQIQSRALTVAVSSTAKEAMDLKVKYTIYGKDSKAKTTVTVGEGEVPVSVKPGSTEKVTTPVVTPAADPADKKASVPRIIGHGVQILNGTTVLAEHYDPANVKPMFDLPPDMRKGGGAPPPPKP